jgi:hypothetical protein
MAISEERIKVLDNEFDIPIADLLSINDSSIRNLVTNALNVFPELVNGLIENVVEDTITAVLGKNNPITKLAKTLPNLSLPITDKQLQNIYNTAINEVTSMGVELGSNVLSVAKTAIGSKLQDLGISKVVASALDVYNDVDSLVGEVLDVKDALTGQYNDLVKALDLSNIVDTTIKSKALEGFEAVSDKIKQLDPDGYKEIINTGISLLDTKVTLQSTDSSKTIVTDQKTINSYKEMLDSLTDGEYSKDSAVSIDDSNTVERVTLAMTKAASSKNIPGIFTAFVAKYENSPGIIKAANTLLNYAKANKNDELFNEIINSSIVTDLVNYNGDSSILINRNYINTSKGEQHYVKLYEQMKTNLTTADSNWNLFNLDNTSYLSASKVTSTDFIKLLETQALANENIFNSDVNDEAYLYLASQVTTHG